MPTVTEMVRKYLEENGYTGLYNEVGECGCELSDLGPCCEGVNARCEAGYKVPCPYKDSEEGCELQEYGDHWHIVGEKPVPPSGFIVGEQYLFVREEPLVVKRPPSGAPIPDTTIYPSEFRISHGDLLLCEANRDGFIDMAHGDLRYRLSIAEYGSCFALLEKK